MTVETELKLRISPEHLARLKRHPLLRSLSSARASTRKLYSVYFDTPDLYLHQHAMAIRLRRVGRGWVQTLKGGGEVQAGLHLRNEWETPVPSETLDFGALAACGAKSLPKQVRKALQPIFVTEFSRTARLLNFAGAEIELSLDSGEIRADREVRQFAEVELELKSGAPVQLFHLALQLLEIVPLALENTSKAEYGYRMWMHAQAEIGRAEKLPINEDDPVASVLQSMIWSCLMHMQANVSGALDVVDDEYLHQMRVALRRLRVALNMAYRVQPDTELDGLRRDVAALTAVLGRTREWDVFVSQTLLPVRKHFPHQAGIESILLGSEQMRKQHYLGLQTALQAQEFQRLQLRFGVWMLGGYWNEACWQEAGPLRLRSFAAQNLQQRSEQVRKRYRKLTQPLALASELHVFRIACKKLRYCAELFAPLYEGNGKKRYLLALVKLQDTLGMMNDIAVARRLLDELGTGAEHEAAMLIRGWVEHDYAQLMDNLHQAWKEFSRCEKFFQ